MKRILIKLSGEQFGGESGKGIDTDVIQLLAQDIKKTKDKHDVEIAIVVGGGNFVRGAELHKNENLILESTAHYMGMLADDDELYGTERYFRKCRSDLSYASQTGGK
jgi:uridylate kinase